MHSRSARLLTAAIVLTASALVVEGAPKTGAPARSASAAKPLQIKGAKQVTSVEGITEYVLDNGMRVLLFPDFSKPTVSVINTIFVGSRHEGYGEAGMAHLLEHMLFKGTPNYPDPKSIPSAIQERAGHNFNATTADDRTNFYETLPASAANLEFAIRLEADRMVNSFIHPADLKSEMTVVRSEFESGENNPGAILEQRMVAAAFEWHNYGKNTIGNRSDIERVPAESLRDFYVRYYQPDNAMLIVAGKFPPKEALELIVKYFGRIPRPERQLNTTYTEEPPQDGEHSVTLRRAGAISVVGALYHIPASGQEDFPAVEILEGILSDNPSGRLYKALVESGQAAGVGGISAALHDPGYLVEQAEAAPGVPAEKVLHTMVETLDGVARKGVTADETQRIKVQILKQHDLTMNNCARLAHELSEYAARGDWRLFFVHRDRIEKVTAQDVSRAAAKYLKPDNRTVGTFIPTKSFDRTAVPLIADLSKAIGNYKGREALAAGEVFDASPANIESRTKLQTLHSGVRAAFLEKKTRGNEVNVRLKLRYGDLAALRGTRTAAELLPQLMLRGTKKLSHQQIEDQLDKLKATVGASGDPGEITFAIRAQRKTLPAVLAIVHQILREPSLPANEFEIIKRAELASLQAETTEPDRLAMNVLRRHLAPYPTGDPRNVPTIDESIEQMKGTTLQDIQKLYSEYLNGAHGDLVVLGDFSTAEVVPLFDAMLADWKSAIPFARVSRDIKQEIPGGRKEIVTPDKANAIFTAALIFPMRDDDADYPALAVGNHILGGSTLSSRLGDRVRQHEGLSYGVSSHLQSSSLDQRTVLLIYAICNPANVEKVRSAISEEFDRLLAKGIDAKELAEAKEGMLNQEQSERAQDRGLTSILASNLEAHRTMKFVAEQEKKIRELTADEIMSVMRRRFDPKRLFVVTAGDFAKGQASAKP